MQSAAQHPPAEILERIVRCVKQADVSSTRNTARTRCDLCMSLRALMDICIAWRQVIASHLFHDINMCTVPYCTCHPNVLCAPPRTSTLLHVALPSTAQHISRMVRVHVQIEDVISGRAMKQFNSNCYGSGILPSAAQLELCFQFGPSIDLSAITDIRSNIRSFSYNLLRIAPSIRQLSVTSRHGETKEFHDPFLWEVINSMEFSTLPLVPPCALHHLRSEGVDSKSQILELVRRNSHTLVTLDLRSATLGAAVNIVQNPDGSLVEYGRLRELSLRVLDIGDYTNTTSDVPISADTLFPALEKLTCTGLYPFPGDLLFRGNTRSLSKLDIAMDRHTLDMLLQAGYLNGLRFPALEHVSLRHSYRADRLSDEQLAMLALRLSPQAAIVKCTGLDWSGFYIVLPEVCEVGWNLRVLEMPTLACSLEQSIRLIDSLPNITKLVFACLTTPELQCSVVDPDILGFSEPLADHIERNVGAICSEPNSIRDLYQDNFPLSRTLHTLGITMYGRCDALAVCRMAVVLSVLCPSISSLAYGVAGSGVFYSARNLASFPEFCCLVNHLQLCRIKNASALLPHPHNF